jgi:hypothetical protein
VLKLESDIRNFLKFAMSIQPSFPFPFFKNAPVRILTNRTFGDGGKRKGCMALVCDMHRGDISVWKVTGPNGKAYPGLYFFAPEELELIEPKADTKAKPIFGDVVMDES